MLHSPWSLPSGSFTSYKCTHGPSSSCSGPCTPCYFCLESSSLRLFTWISLYHALGCSLNVTSQRGLAWPPCFCHGSYPNPRGPWIHPFLFAFIVHCPNENEISGKARVLFVFFAASSLVPSPGSDIWQKLNKYLTSPLHVCPRSIPSTHLLIGTC